MDIIISEVWGTHKLNIRLLGIPTLIKAKVVSFAHESNGLVGIYESSGNGNFRRIAFKYRLPVVEEVASSLLHTGLWL